MPPPARVRRIDPLGLWFCGLAVLGLARAWLYLVRDGGNAGAVGWAWLGGALLLACLGLGMVLRGLARPRPDARRQAPPRT